MIKAISSTNGTLVNGKPIDESEALNNGDVLLIGLEINEKAITDLERMKRLSSVLKNLDIGLAYDDFGVGQTRLVELAKFPPEFL